MTSYVALSRLDRERAQKVAEELGVNAEDIVGMWDRVETVSKLPPIKGSTRKVIKPILTVEFRRVYAEKAWGRQDGKLAYVTEIAYQNAVLGSEPRTKEES